MHLHSSKQSRNPNSRAGAGFAAVPRCSHSSKPDQIAGGGQHSQTAFCSKAPLQAILNAHRHGHRGAWVICCVDVGSAGLSVEKLPCTAGTSSACLAHAVVAETFGTVCSHGPTRKAVAACDQPVVADARAACIWCSRLSIAECMAGCPQCCLPAEL